MTRTFDPTDAAAAQNEELFWDALLAHVDARYAPAPPRSNRSRTATVLPAADRPALRLVPTARPASPAGIYAVTRTCRATRASVTLASGLSRDAARKLARDIRPVYAPVGPPTLEETLYSFGVEIMSLRDQIAHAEAAALMGAAVGTQTARLAA